MDLFFNDSPFAVQSSVFRGPYHRPATLRDASVRGHVRYVRRDETFFESGPGYRRFERRVQQEAVVDHGGPAVAAPRATRRAFASSENAPQHGSFRAHSRFSSPFANAGEVTIEELPDEPEAASAASWRRGIAAAPDHDASTKQAGYQGLREAPAFDSASSTPRLVGAASAPEQSTSPARGAGARGAQLSSEVGTQTLWQKLCAPFSRQRRPDRTQHEKSDADVVAAPARSVWTLTLWILAAAALVVGASFFFSRV